jgi:hypothetical protein
MAKRVALVMAMLFFPVLASADTVWTYSGNASSNPLTGIGPNPCHCALDGSVTLDAAGTPVAWSFTDGTHTLTNLNSTGLINDNVSGSGSLPFSTWNIQLMDGGVMVQSNFDGSVLFAHDNVAVNNMVFLDEQGNPGTWSTPEPGSLGLLAIGLVLGLFMVRKKSPRAVFSWQSL